MTTPRVRTIKKASGAPSVSEQHLHNGSSVPIGVAPSDDELATVVSMSTDDSATMHQDAWMYRWGIFVLICLIGATLIIATYRLMLSRWESDPPSSSPVTTVVQHTPTPMQVAFDRSQVRVHVINATGITGKAKSVMDKAVTLGYTDGGVETAGKTVSKTEIFIGYTVSAYTDGIQKDAAFLLDRAAIPVMAETIDHPSFDIRIILGEDL